MLVLRKGKNQKYGFWEEEDWKIEPKYLRASAFYKQGWAIVEEVAGKYILINEKGENLTKEVYVDYHISPYGVLLSKEINNQVKCGMVDQNLNPIVDFIFDHIDPPKNRWVTQGMIGNDYILINLHSKAPNGSTQTYDQYLDFFVKNQEVYVVAKKGTFIFLIKVENGKEELLFRDEYDEIELLLDLKKIIVRKGEHMGIVNLKNLMLFPLDAQKISVDIRTGYFIVERTEKFEIVL